ncbi:MAG: hypothetical protein IH889_07225 [Planctomycetes bacterium]|nr:hypothetical protein [Planctomycetota bacterium]
MAEGLTRIRLPSGGWWEFFTRPRWRHVREWQSQCVEGSGSVSPEGALASLTTAWSFADEVSVDAISRLDESDLIVALEAFHRQVVPFLDRTDEQGLAQALFAGLLGGRVPSEVSEVHLMAATGWSWHTLQETPADVVRMMAIYSAVAQAVERGGSIDFPAQGAERYAG